MTTKAQMIEIIKSENPMLQIGDDERGYTQLSATDYEAQILEWANARLEKEKNQEATAQATALKTSALSKLEVLGLTEQEAQLLLGS